MNLVFLATRFLTQAGRTRALVTCLCTAVVSGLLYVAVAVVQFRPTHAVVTDETGSMTGTSIDGAESVANLLRDGGVRPGYVFALLLICLVPGTLLQQVVRLGTASRERRLAGLRVAGATPAQVRALAAIEVGVPALVGGLLGWPVFLGLRALFGGTGASRWGLGDDVTRELRMIPTTVGPTWWQVALVVLAVGLLGTLVGALGSRAIVESPLDLSRGGSRQAPRPWLPLALLGTGVALLISYPLLFGSDADTVTALAGITCTILGILAVAPWVAYRVGGRVAERASSPALMLAARRLVMDARPAGRAASATGAIALVTGGATAFLAEVTTANYVDPIHVVPTVMVFVVLLFALLVTTFALVVHSVEAITDRRRSLASLVAEGMPRDVLERAQRWEVALVALPISAAGVTATTVPMAFLLGSGLPGVGVQLVVVGLVLLLIWAALTVSTQLVRPWLARAADPANLRTG